MTKSKDKKQTTEISDTSIKTSFLNHLTHTVGRPLEFSTPQEQYRALAHTVRDLVMENWISTCRSVGATAHIPPELRVERSTEVPNTR